MEGVASSAQMCYCGLREEKSEARGCRPITVLGLIFPPPHPQGIRGLRRQGRFWRNLSLAHSTLLPSPEVLLLQGSLL